MQVTWKALLSAILFGGRAATAGHIRRGSDESASTSEREEERGLRPDDVPPVLVDYVYTYGAPSTSDPPASNPGDKCIPGIRTYTEDVSSGDRCSWWNSLWCDPSERVENTDFAAKINNDDYAHPKTSTLVLRERDGRRVEYIWRECEDSDDVERYGYQKWPDVDQPAGIVPGRNIHRLDEHYEKRIRRVPLAARGPLLEYASVAKCGYRTSEVAVRRCLTNYANGLNGLPGIGRRWEVAAFMNHETDLGAMGTDEDVVYVLKNDDDRNNVRCIVNFMGSQTLGGDHVVFLGDNARPARYCGRRGVHRGVRDELRRIVGDPAYRTAIKPALERCHEVTCTGHSLGGALCNVFTMCANQGPENLDDGDGPGMFDDYESLAWTKPTA